MATISVVFAGFYQTAVQAQSWQHFSTPDDSLSVELPAKPNVLKEKNESLDVIFKHSKLAYSYSVNLGFESEPEILFSVLLLSKVMSNRDFDRTVNSNMLWIGGDDKHFSREAGVIVNGLHGREFVFDKGDMSGRALFVNGGTHIYYLMFQSETYRAKSAEVVVRIFNSFRPLKRSRVFRNVQQALGTIFEPILQALRQKTRVPLRLPTYLALEEETYPLTAIIELAAPTRYRLQLAFTPDCAGGNVCRYGMVSGQAVGRKAKRMRGKAVKLAKGITGYFIDAECGANCSDSTLVWQEGAYRYTVGIKAANLEILRKVANSAIETGVVKM